METPLATLADLDAAAIDFLRRHPQGAIVGLSGELGVGKTAFVRAVVTALAARKGIAAPRVVSPSFVLHQSYPELPVLVEHFDLYRLDRADGPALVEIGYFEALERARAAHGYCLVEWPERATDNASLQLEILLQLEFRGTGRMLREVP